MGKRRRLIVNDDGEVGFGEKVNTIEQFLVARFDGCRDTHVDAYFLNIAATDRGPVRGGKPILHPQSTMALYYYWDREGRIPAQVDEAIRAMIEHARRAGMEIFASIRMNDCHNYQGVIETTYPLKVQRPDLVLGTVIDRAAYPDMRTSMLDRFWLGFNYAKEEVREHFLQFIMAHCLEYDYDGVELDFLREGMYFRFGEEMENIAVMTDFVRKIRDGLNTAGEARKRPYQLAVRVHDTPAQALRAGLDAEQWMKQGLMDMLMVGGGYMPSGARIKEHIDMAHHYGIPAYPSINNFKAPIQLRSWASNFWALGADGIYLFNWYGLEHYGLDKGSEGYKCLSQMGDPDVLHGLDKEYDADNGESYAWHGFNNQPPQFPVRLLDGTPIKLVVGDDLRRSADGNRMANAKLHIEVDHMDPKEDVRIAANGHWIPANSIERTSQQVFEADVPVHSVRRGINSIEVLPGPQSMGRLASVVNAVALRVSYPRQRKTAQETPQH